ncbi:MAG: hypothetical protein ABUL60_31235 [Myxococcales bacterium]
MPTAFETIAIVASLSLTLGCAGTSAPATPAASPAAPATQAAHPTAAEPAPSAAASAPEASPADASPTKPADEPRDGLRKASRPPLELLTGNNVVYVLNFSASKVGEAAKERCESEHADDPGAARECLNKERAKVAIESVRFVKDPSGQYWWVTYNRYKGNLLKWHRIQFLPGKADADSVTLNLTGKDKGIAPMPKVPSSLNIELPNDYSIVVSDPEYGAMAYDAKIGLLEQD